MTAVATSYPDSSMQGMVPFDARRHLRAVSALISEVFAPELDANGRTALQEMNLVARLSPVLGSILSPAIMSEFLSGYVWIEDGQVVGNVSLQRADSSGSRWRISNVAVAPGYRGRGIARTLMIGSLKEIATRGGNWAVLQVRVENAVARQLYQKLGFMSVCQDGVWVLPKLPPRPPVPDTTIPLRRLSGRHWQERLQLARVARPPLAGWANAIDPSAYRAGFIQRVGEAMGALTGVRRSERWGAWQDGQLVAEVEAVQALFDGAHRLQFTAHPQIRGRLEDALIAQGLQALARAGRHPVRSEHSGDDAAGVAALENAGFRAERVLLTMRRPMTSADVDL